LLAQANVTATRKGLTNRLVWEMHLAGKSVIDVVVTQKTTTYPPNKMQLKTILNAVEKQKGFVYQAIRWSDDRKSLLVSLRPHARSRPVCSGCGGQGPGYDKLAERKFEFVPLWAIPVFFLYGMRRVDCPACGVTVEKVPWADGKHRSTFSYRLFLATWARRLSWKETATVLGTSWDTVFLGHGVSGTRCFAPLIGSCDGA